MEIAYKGAAVTLMSKPSGAAISNIMRTVCLESLKEAGIVRVSIGLNKAGTEITFWFQNDHKLDAQFTIEVSNPTMLSNAALDLIERQTERLCTELLRQAADA